MASENIHLQPYSSEEDFYERIYPKYLTLLEKAKVFMEETQADPARTIVLIRCDLAVFVVLSPRADRQCRLRRL